MMARSPSTQSIKFTTAIRKHLRQHPTPRNIRIPVNLLTSTVDNKISNRLVFLLQSQKYVYLYFLAYIGNSTMSLIAWDNSLTVGINEIDEQHHKLVQLINGLHNHMLAGDASTIMNKVLDRIIEYTGFHFATEEQLMLENDYPDSIAHKQQHKELVDTAIALQEKLKSGNTHLTMETLHFLQDWLQHHILGSDKKFAKYLISKDVK